MTARYARAPSPELLAMFRPGGVLHALTKPLACTVDGKAIRVDVQFRENDHVMLYAGQTRVLSLARRGDGVVAEAHETYATQPCAADMLKLWTTSIDDALVAYLGALRIGSRWVSREGAVQVRWMGNDPDATGRVPWIPIDREAVLGYDVAVEADAELAQARARVVALAERHGWGPPKAAAEGNELDQLAISADGTQIVLVELKPAGSGTATYAPLQLLRYLTEWRRALTDVVGGVRALVAAKVTAGLLPASATLSATPALRAVVGFNEPPSAEAQRRLRLVLDELAAPIDVWCWPNRALPHVLMSSPTSQPPGQ